MSLENQIREIIVEQLDVTAEEVVPSGSFIDDLGADSLDTVELIMALEEKFGMTISDENAEKMTTVQHVYDYVEEYLGGSAE